VGRCSEAKTSSGAIGHNCQTCGSLHVKPYHYILSYLSARGHVLAVTQHAQCRLWKHSECLGGNDKSKTPAHDSILSAASSVSQARVYITPSMLSSYAYCLCILDSTVFRSAIRRRVPNASTHLTHLLLFPIRLRQIHHKLSLQNHKRHAHVPRLSWIPCPSTSPWIFTSRT
jgi:hypothetical protein